MLLATGLNSELADPGRSQARNNIRELSMEKPAVRVWRRRMETAYILFERFSKQSCCEGQGRRGLEGLAQPLSHPKCHPVLYRNSCLQGESEPSLSCPQNRDVSRRAGKASSQPAVRAPACSDPLPTCHLATFCTPWHLHLPRERLSFQLWLFPLRSQIQRCRTGRTLSRQELPKPSGSC